MMNDHFHPKEKLLWNVREAAEALGGISARTLWGLTKSRKIRCTRLGRRVMYTRAQLLEFLDAQTEGAADR